jgi:hypothetical protein
MAIIEVARIQVRRGRETVSGPPKSINNPNASWELEPGEFGWAEDTQRLWIGKRVSEGASDNLATQILTENDLPGIWNILANASTSSVNTAYTYRNDSAWISTAPYGSTPRTVQHKLDDTVSIADFGIPINNDISNTLNHAITTIFDNSTNKDDSRRALKIPAGNYIVTGTIDLPPKTVLIGDGRGLTTLVLANNSGPMFRTVDEYGIGYDNSQMQTSSTSSSRDVLISDMTLSHMDSNNTDPLISLDNTRNTRIHNVGFNTKDSADIVNTGTAILIQGTATIYESQIVSRNIEIIDCIFNSIGRAIDINGSVTGPIIENNVFSNLRQGVRLLAASTATSPPVNVTINNNKFMAIAEDAILVGTSTFTTNVISSHNTYHYVGNGNSMADDNTTTSGLAVITFNSPGNMSVNDYFNRKIVAANPTSPSGFYYNPLVSGNSRIDSAASYKTDLAVGVTTNVIKVGMTKYDQVGYIEYQLSNADMSRKGRLTLNISTDGYASVSDYYNYSEYVTDASTLLVFSTDLTHSDTTEVSGPYKNYITLTCVNQSTRITQLEYSINLMV